MNRRLISSGSTFEDQIGYSRAVVDGDWVFVSGTTGFDYATMTISDGLVEQAEQCLKNIEAALQEAGSRIAGCRAGDLRAAGRRRFRAVLAGAAPVFRQVRPAAMMIAAGLADPRMKIEIEVTALKPSKAARPA